jgi:hypothetical protein
VGEFHREKKRGIIKKIKKVSQSRRRNDSDPKNASTLSPKKVGKKPKLPSLARLFLALKENGIRFQIAGMTAALLQGVPSTTLDTDLWIDLPERQYIRVMTICKTLNATLLAKTVVELDDGLLVNFLYRVDGVGSFAQEWKKSNYVRIHGIGVRLLHLKSILRSKIYIRREKDLAHIPILRATIREIRKKNES